MEILEPVSFSSSINDCSKNRTWDKRNSLECSCENYNKKFYAVCDICSEKTFLKKSCELSNSSPEYSDSSSFSEE